MLFNTEHIAIDELSSGFLKEKDVTLLVARLDNIHPVVSGNKLFKLQYYLEDACRRKRPIVTFGGAFSNHLAATAFACRQAGLQCAGIVRGEKPARLSATLQHCITNGMELFFISRQLYSSISANDELSGFPGLPADAVVIPEGGYHPIGARGASLIIDKISGAKADVVITAVGTATTFAGLLRKMLPGQRIIGVPVLKNLDDLEARVQYLNNDETCTRIETWNEYHFGGYAKKSAGLIRFMNDIYGDYGIPTDFVYTAKMLFGVMDKIKNNYFRAGSRILCLHTGGLQGNSSLPPGTLIF
jgi:1-aminocyclopropane-1-carboxylate deaminase/D-cysteine desulfhydrase-like pyridoxal-dependent ACC family enzyme